MKKNIIIAAIVAATALFFTASCAKQEPVGSETPGEGRTFSAVIEQNLTKTTITSELKVHWQNGDLININGYKYVATAKIPATKALFFPVREEAPRSGKYLAFFPSSIMKEDGSSYLPQTQTYVPGAFNSPMYAVSETEELSFRNLCGVLHFAIKGAEKVGTITVKANENLWGSFTISEDGSAVLRGGGDNTVTLDCGENGVQLNPDNATDFYISLPAGTYSTGMEITLTGTDSEKFNVTKTTAREITIVRNTVYDLEWNFEPTVNETLAQFFKDMAKDQAALAAATDEATREMTPEQIKYTQVHPEEFFLPEIHTWENAHSAIKAIDKGLGRLWDEELTEVQKKQKEVELHFFRALLYFELFRTYGYALYKGDEYQSPCPSNQIFTEIMNGAKIASDCLPQSYDETDRIITLDEGVEVTRPTQWAAKALFARACLYAASPLFKISAYNEALQYSEAVVKGSQFDLEPKYSDLWGINAFDNKELIFGVRLASNDAYKGIHPTEHLYKNFESGDVRLEPTIGKTDTGFNLNKPVDHIIPIFRYADILLIYVESKLLVGDTAYANDWLNKLRHRAGLSDVEATMDLIEKERMTELAFEGHRFWDVRRLKEGSKFFTTIDNISRTWDDKYNFYPVPQN